MSNKSLTILGLVAAILLAGAIVQSRLARRGSHPPVSISRPLIQGLDTGAIAGIVVSGQGESVTLKRMTDHFVAVSKHNYPAVYGNINSLIATCLDISVTEPITSNPENHGELGVLEEGAQYVVKFLDAEEKIITGVVVGNTGVSAQSSRHVRSIDGDEVYLAEKPVWLRTDAISYLDSTIFKIDKDKIASVKLSGPGGQYTIGRDDAGKIVLQDVGSGKKPKASEYEQVFGVLGQLSFSDVQPANGPAAQFDFDHTFICTLNNSTIYTLKLAGQDDKHYLTCSAEYTGPKQIVKEGGVESEEQLKEKADKLQAQEDALRFAGQHEAWIYEIPSYQGALLTKKLADLVEDDAPSAPAVTEPQG